MSDFISRQKLCDNLREYKVHLVSISSDESEIKGYNDGIDLAISVITDFSSAEIERKKGEWIFHLDDLFPEESTQECSVCHEEESIKIQNDNFCPNCGADMRGE